MSVKSSCSPVTGAVENNSGLVHVISGQRILLFVSYFLPSWHTDLYHPRWQSSLQVLAALGIPLDVKPHEPQVKVTTWFSDAYFPF